MPNFTTKITVMMSSNSFISDQISSIQNLAIKQARFMSEKKCDSKPSHKMRVKTASITSW